MGKAMKAMAIALLFFAGMLVGAIALLFLPQKLLAKILSRLALGRLVGVLPGQLGKNLQSSVDRAGTAAELAGSGVEATGKAARRAAGTARSGRRDES